MDNETTVSDLIAARIRDLRVRRGLTTADLAERCAKLGAPHLSMQALYKFESRRTDGRVKPRPLRVDELLVLAMALDASPVHLIVGLDDDAPFPVTPSLTVPAGEARQWIRGWPHSRNGLPGTDGHLYRQYSPDSEDVVVTMTENEFDTLVERARRRSA
jgi:transcriptional regulator with XRE-family HTH domain